MSKGHADPTMHRLNSPFAGLPLENPSRVAPKGSITGATKYQMYLDRKKKEKGLAPIPEDLRVLASNIDGLTIYVEGDICESLEMELDLSLEQAVADKVISGEGRAHSPLPPLFGDGAVVLDHGASGYRWLVESADYKLRIQRPKRDGHARGNFLPRTILRVSALALWRLGGSECIRELSRWAALVYEPGYKLVPSNVHLCVDYQGYDVSQHPNSHFVTRADTIKRENHATTDALIQLSAGRSNKTRATIYDKSKEITKSGKEWMIPIWEHSGAYRHGETVWRLENQFGSETLRDKGINTLDDLEGKLVDLWSYGLDWFSLRVPGEDDSNRSRWDVHPVWRGLRATLCGKVPYQVKRPKRHEQVVNKVRRHERAIIGHVLTLMHLYGETDLPRQLEKTATHFELEGRDLAKLLDIRAKRLPGLHAAAV